MMRNRVALLVAFACTACYPLDAKFELAIDAQFTPQEWCLTAEAARRWGLATGGIVDITYSTGVSTAYFWDGPRHEAYRGYDGDAHEQNRTSTAFGWTKYAPGGPMWAYVDRMHEMYRDPHDYAQVFLYVQMHELGHHLGLGHTGAHTLMAGPGHAWSWDNGGEPYMTQTDLDAFCALYGCHLIAAPCGDDMPKSFDVCP